MPKERKPGWKYFYSEFLKEEFAIHEESGWVYFEKGARYSPDEIRLMKDNGLQLDMASHKVKSVIGGELVGYDKHGANSKNKSNESSSVENKSDNSGTSGKISKDIGNVENDESGEFFIY
jgi:hypothetical protein